jgi:two-component system CheB/CheR fusion protein
MKKKKSSREKAPSLNSPRKKNKENPRAASGNNRRNKNKNKNNLITHERFPIVAIGGSAGGLEALQKFFPQMPAGSGMGFVVIPHLDPDHESMMTDLLRRLTRMPVDEAKEGMAVESDHIYVIPPNRDMSIFNRTLSLAEPKKAHGLRMPIDAFFRSLAEDQGESAICIILSGTGTDGTLGLRAIHGAGGMCMIQDADSSRYDAMPRSAMNTGLADYILPPEKMPEQLIEYVKKLSRKKGKLELTERRADGLRKILSMVRTQTGHDFSLYKKTTLSRRIEKRLNLHNLEDVNSYVEYLKENSEEVHNLFKDMVIGVTNFFRDPEAFRTLQEKILPAYVKQQPAEYNFRVWVPGCGSGEEAYSIAMILTECTEALKRDLRIQIFGTDIDEEALNVARAGFYSDNIGADVSKDRLRRFFIRENGGFRVKKEMRDMVVFAVQDVTKDPPFTKLDMLSCRNLLIYMETELQDRLLPLFHYSLKPEGFLFLGTSETIGKYTDLFNVLDKKWKLFRSKKTLSVREEIYTALPWTHGFVPRGEGEVKKEEEINISTLAQYNLLQNYAPPSVIVNNKGEILYIHGQTGKYLEPAPGQANLNILEMAREGIRNEIRAGLHQALTRAREKKFSHLHVKTNGTHQEINLMIKPLQQPREARGLVLISFEDVLREKPEPGAKKKTLPGRTRDRRMAELEQELNFTRETLQATIEELQASNEELKSTNEELQSTNEEFQSTNEELETSREELQSVNEELVTVNSELQAKIDLLTRTEQDMKILLDNTKIGIIFLDNDLRINRFTSEALKIFKLIPSDVGRPIHDIRANMEYDALENDARQVLETLRVKETEVLTNEGRTYFMRILPYRTGEGRIEGVVVTFNDTSQVREMREFKAAWGFAKNIAETIREPLLALDRDLKVIWANRSFYRIFRMDGEETEGRRIFEIGNGQWDIPPLRELLLDIIPNKKQLEDFEVVQELPQLGKRRILLNARKIIEAEEAAIPLILLAMEDVTDRKPC